MRRHLIPVLLVAVVITAACGDDGDDGGGADAATSTTSTTSTTTERPSAPAAPEDLIGVEWVVTGFVEGDRAFDLEPPIEDGFIVLGPEGFVSGNDGCNRLGWSESESGERSGLAYEIADGSITYTGGAVSTLIGCPQEGYVARFHAVIDGTVSYELDGDELTLFTGRERGVVFTAER